MNIPVTVKVTPQEDMPIDVSVLVPKGVGPVANPGIKIMPCRDGYAYNYWLTLGLWSGPLIGGETKIFTFEVTASQKGSYQFLFRAYPLVKWGATEEAYTLVVN